MKKFSKLFFTLFLFITIYSCSKEEPIINENATLNKKKFDLNFTPSDFDLDISIVKNYEFGYSSRDKIDQLITTFTNELFRKQEKLEEPLLGFDLKVSLNTSRVEPITKSKSNTASKGNYILKGNYVIVDYPNKNENFDTYHSKNWVKKTIFSLLEKNRKALYDNDTLSLKVLKTTKGNYVIVN